MLGWRPAWITVAYSADLRERALARKQAGETNREIAAALRISPSCVSKWTKRKHETGSLAPAQIGGYKPRTLSGESTDWLRARIAPGRSPCEACRPVGRTGDQDASAGGVGVQTISTLIAWPTARAVASPTTSAGVRRS
jgi:hypothetical protein